MEDEGQNIHLKNLSVHPAGNEEDALNLLFLGDTNRMIAEVKFLDFLVRIIIDYSSNIRGCITVRIYYNGYIFITERIFY